MDRITKLKEFLLTRPDDSFLLHALALEYVKNKQDDEAEKLFRKVITIGKEALGTFYHLGKLLERKGNREGAVSIYKEGMEACKKAGDQHAYRELQAAYEDLIY